MISRRCNGATESQSRAIRRLHSPRCFNGSHVAELRRRNYYCEKGETQLAIKEATLKGRRYVLCRNEEKPRKDADRRAASLAGFESHDVKPKDTRCAHAHERHTRMNRIPYVTVGRTDLPPGNHNEPMSGSRQGTGIEPWGKHQIRLATDSASAKAIQCNIAQQGAQ
jgi:hypothetical protein